MAEFLVAHGVALLFYLFAALAVGGALVVIIARNPMFGAIGLLLSFVSVAALFLLRHAEFLAVVQLFVYGGGIMVLFLFVIMLVQLHRLSEMRVYGEHSGLAILVAVLLVALLAFVFLSVPFGAAGQVPEAFVNVEGESLGNSQAVAWILYREYLLPFEIASVFLLVAMIGAVVLGRRT